MLPVSRCPRVREPITKSCVPRRDRLDELRYERWNVAAIAIEKDYDVTPATARPKPRERLPRTLVRNHAAQL